MVVGLTGGIASGKSTVSQILRKHGAHCYDADAIAHECYKTDFVQEDLIEEFGEEIYKDGELNRKYLKDIVFNSSEKLKALNAIIHPCVRDVYRMMRETSLPGDIDVFDIPLLYESKMEDLCDYIIVVTAPYGVQLQRVKARDGISAELADKIIKSQMDTDEKAKRADYVICNDGDLENLEKKTLEVLEDLQKKKEKALKKSREKYEQWIKEILERFRT